MRRDLNNGANIENSTTRHENEFSAKPLSEVVDQNRAKETSGLEGTDNVRTQRRRLFCILSIEAKPSLESRQRERTANEGGVVTKHGRTHGCGASQEVYAPVVHL
jgi:hypothetical protein